MGMDLEHERVKASQKASALLAGDEHFSSRVISRDKLAGGSSRVFYYRSNEGVPFKWERQPGTPKQPPEEEIIPPISPPPAVLSLGLPKPCVVIEEAKSSRFKLWKHMISKKTQANHAAQESPRRSNITNAASGSDGSERFESFTTSSDGEFMASPRNSNPSSSSSPSFSDNRSRRSSISESPAVRESTGGPYGCSPWNFTSILVCVPRRI